MSKHTITIEVSGYSSYVSDPNMDEHLRVAVREIVEFANNIKYDECYRKVQVDYEQQEDANMEIHITVVEE